MIKQNIVCEACGAKLGQMRVQALAGGSNRVVLGYIQPRIKFYCAECAKKGVSA